jgi:Tfp pilus assembly protein PilO
MTDSDFQLKILIAIITVSFTIIMGIAGYLVKKLIDDLGGQLKAISADLKDLNRLTNDHAVKLARHELKLEYLEETFRNLK